MVGDFEPIGLISISSLMLVGRADLPASNLAELVTQQTPQALGARHRADIEK